ncbi:extracellular solute-binding protein [Lachnospiraceae bacterium LCP25S3_G4]
MTRKKKVLILIGGLLLGLCIIYLIYQNQKETVIELGIFTGSNWDVANANSYTIVDSVISEFEERYPGVKVHYTSGIRKSDYSEWYAQKALNGETPDVAMVLSDDFEKLVSMGALKNLDSFMKKDSKFEESKFYETAFRTGKVKQKQYALPYEVVPTLMFVNKTLLHKEGFSVPDINWTWENLLNICESVTKDIDGDGVLEQFGTYNYEWEDAIYTNGSKIFSEDGKEAYLSDERAMDTIKFMKKLEELNQGEKVTQDDFDAGNVAFMPLSFAEYRTYKTYPYKIKKYSNFQWDCITLPAGPDGENTSKVSTLLMGISENTKEEELAWELLKLFTTDNRVQMKIFQYSQGASVLKEVTNSNESEYILRKGMEANEKVINNSVLSNVIEKGVVVPKFQKYDEAMVLVESQVNSILNDEINADSTMKIFQRKMNTFLNQ